METWKQLEKNESLFMVSDLGNILKLKKGEFKECKQYSMGGYPNSRYKAVWDKGIHYYVHRLVVESFIGEIPEGYVVNHKDRNKHNNNVENLEIVTPSENIKHLFRTNPPKPPKQPEEPIIEKEVVFIMLDENDNIVAEFYSENAVCSFLACLGLEESGAIKKNYLNIYQDDRYYIKRLM